MSLGYNPGLAFIQAHEQVYQARHASKENILHQLETYNMQIKDLSKLITEITQRKPSGKADFSDEPEFMDLIDRIREAHTDPHTHASIIASHKYSWTDEREMDIVLQAMNDRVKILSQDENIQTMYLNQEFQDTTQISDIAKKCIDGQARHIDGLNQKMGRV